MVKGSLASIFCAIAALVALPAYGADDIASRVQMCATCHGEDGKPLANTTPPIWGQQASYLYKELHDYHSGARANPIMAPIANTFSLEELRAVADYFAAKTWPTGATKAAANAPPAGVAMCKACHGQNFEGGAPGPRFSPGADGGLLHPDRGRDGPAAAPRRHRDRRRQARDRQEH